MIPQDPAYEAKVRESFGRQNHMTTLGAAIEFLAPGEVHLSLPFAPRFCQQNGFMHAGAIASVADSANGYAAYSLAPPDTDVLAVEFKINLLAPARAESFLACGRVLRAGRTLTVCQAEVFTAGRDERTLVAVMLSTLIVRPMAQPAPEAHPLGSETPMERTAGSARTMASMRRRWCGTCSSPASAGWSSGERRPRISGPVAPGLPSPGTKSAWGSLRPASG